jgi:hypothetical protein
LKKINQIDKSLANLTKMRKEKSKDIAHNEIEAAVRISL